MAKQKEIDPGNDWPTADDITSNIPVNINPDIHPGMEWTTKEEVEDIQAESRANAVKGIDGEGVDLYSAEKAKVQEAFLAAGISAQDLKQTGWLLSDLEDPYGPNPYNSPNVYNWTEQEEPFLSDLTGGVYNTLVLGLGEGIADLIPTVYQAFAPETPENTSRDHWASKWIKNTSEFFDAQQAVYSDAAYAPIDEWGDYFKQGKFASTLGEGIGYVAGIIGGAKTIGSISAIGKTGKAFAQAYKGGSRLGSFFTGTALMYGDIYDEALELGFKGQDAARLSLATSSVVSMTEGAALEWIGKGFTNWIPNSIVKSSLRGAVKESEAMGAASRKFNVVNKLFSTKLMQNLASKEGQGAFRGAVSRMVTGGANTSTAGIKNGLKNIAAGVAKGAAIEFGQEFSQTYIEDGIKEMYDTFITKTNLVDDSRMWSQEQLRDAVYGGIIGSIIGGGLGGGANIKHSFKENRESVLGYMTSNVNNGTPNKNKKLFRALDRQLSKGKISEETHALMKSELESSQQYAEEMKGLDLQDPVANAQLYDIFKLREKTQEKINGIIAADQEGTLDPLIAEKHSENIDKASKISKKISAFAKEIIENKTKLTKDRGRFDKMMEEADMLYQDVLDNKVTNEEFESRLDKITLEDGKQKISDKQESQKAEEAKQEQKNGETVSSVQEQQEEIDAAKIEIDELNLKRLKEIEEAGVEKEGETGYFDQGIKEIEDDLLSKIPKEEHSKAKGLIKGLVGVGKTLKQIEARVEKEFGVSAKATKGSLRESANEEINKKYDNLIEDVKTKNKAKTKTKSIEDAVVEKLKKKQILSKEERAYYEDNQERIDTELNNKADVESNTVEWEGDDVKSKSQLKDESDEYDDQTLDEKIRRTDKAINANNKRIDVLEQKSRSKKGLTEKESNELADLKEQNSLLYEMQDQAHEDERSEKVSKPKVVKDKPIKKKKYEISKVSDTATTVNGVDYSIVTDENGNVVGLRTEENPDQIITNKEMLVAVEIERNKNDYQAVKDEVVDSQFEEIILSNPRIAEVIESVTASNYNDTVDSALDKIFNDQELNDQEKLQLEMWLNQAIEKAFDLAEAYPNDEHVEALLDNLKNIRTELYEKYESEPNRQSTQEVSDNIETENQNEESLERDELIENEEELDSRKSKFIKSAKNYLSKTKDSIDLIRQSVNKAYSIINKKGVSGTYTEEDRKVINEAIKNVIKMVPQVGAAIAPIPGSATALQILKNKIPFLKKLLSYSRNALDSHTGKQTEVKAKRSEPGLKNEIDLEQAIREKNSKVPDDLDLGSRFESDKDSKPTQQASEVEAKEINTIKSKLGDAKNENYKESPRGIVIYDLENLDDNGNPKPIFESKDTSIEEQLSKKYIKDSPAHKAAIEKYGNNPRYEIAEKGTVSLIDKTQIHTATINGVSYKFGVQNYHDGTSRFQVSSIKIVNNTGVIDKTLSKQEIDSLLSVPQPAQQTTEVEAKDKPKMQLTGFTPIQFDSRVEDDPILFDKIRKHFKKLFPGITNELVDKIVDEHGNQALGRIVSGAIEIDRNSAFQSTLIHEYAEAYLDLMEAINPNFVKRGLEIVKGSKLHEEAKKMYSEYDAATQLREALVQSITENAFEKLTERLGQNKAQQMVAWLKRLWNNIKNRFTNKNKQDIIGVMGSDLALRSNPFISAVPKSSSRYQLNGKNTEVTDPAMKFIANLTNKAIVEAKFNSIDIKEGPKASDAVYFSIKSLYDQYVAEMTNASSKSIFNRREIGVTKQDIDDNGINSPVNLQKFFTAFKNDQAERWGFIKNAIESNLKNKEESQEEQDNRIESEQIAKTIIKPEAKLSANTRTVIDSIMDDVDGSPMSKDAVMRTVLSASSRSYTGKQFLKKLKKRASGDLAAERLSFLLESLPAKYSKPIIRDLSSLGQKKSRANIVGETEDGGLLSQNKVVNNDNTQGDLVNILASSLMRSYRSGKYSTLKNDYDLTVRSTNPDDATKEILLEQLIRDLFEIPNFSFKAYKDLVNAKSHIAKVMFMLNELSDKMSTAKTIKQVVQGNESLFRDLAKGESQIDALANSYINTSGKRAPSYKFESSFSTVTRVLNDHRYVKRLGTQPLYKDNPIVKMVASGTQIEEDVQDAVSNTKFGTATEYSNMSTIDNKTVGLWEFMAAFHSKHDTYKQWIGPTADRSYMTQFTAPLHLAMVNGQIRPEFAKTLNNMYKRDQKMMEILKSDYDKMSENDKAVFRDAAQAMTINTINKDLSVTENKNPFKDGIFAHDMDLYVTELESLGLTKGLAEKSVDQKFDMENEEDQALANKIVKELVQNYWANDYVNRKSLEDLYTGPFERHLIKHKLIEGKQTPVAKGISEPIKRAGLGNSNGFLNELPGPARVVVLNMPSDSYGLNSPSLQSILKENGGALDVVGANVKDGNFQVDHMDNGRTISMKRSAFGVERILDEAGNTIGTNADEMTTPENNHPTSMKNMANALVAFEDHLKSQGMSDLITMVDTDVMKNDLPKGTVIMSDKDFIDAVNNKEFDKLMNNFPETNLPGYRTSFNLHKDPRKVHVSEQKVVRTVSGVVHASNNDTATELQEFDEAYVEMQEEGLGKKVNEDGEVTYQTFRNLADSNTLINAALEYADETNTTFQQELLRYIKGHNDNNIVFRRLSKMLNAKTVTSSEAYIESLNKSIESMDVVNPLRATYKEIVSDLQAGRTLTEIVSAFENYKIQIRTHDHPNLKFLMDAAVASRLTKKGIRIEMPGLYSVVAPDFNNDLEFHKGTRTDGGFKFESVSDVAVPWSMFVTPNEGESNADARARAEVMLKEANESGIGLRVVAERVPTSGPTMIFPSKVKYFTDGASNNVITPREFIDVSDSDHDGDKLFLYRQEIDADGNLLTAEQSKKSNLFEMMYNRFASQDFIEKTMTESVSVERFKERAKAVIEQMTEISEETTSIRTLEGVSQMANAMKDGATGIGIFAVAVKTLSLMYQSGVTVKHKLTVDLGTEIEVNGKKISSFTIDEIDIANLETAGLYLQSALDNAKEMALSFAGVTKDNMGTVSAMLISGMNVEEITAVLNNPEVKNYMNIVNADKSAFSLNPKTNLTELRSKKKISGITEFLKGKLTALQFNELKDIDAAREKIPFTGKREDGIYRRAATVKNKRSYFQIETVDGVQTIQSLTAEQAQDSYLLSNENASDLLNGYFKLEDIGNELSILTPVIQLDGGLTNTGLKSRNVQKNIQRINDRDGFDFFDVDKLAMRPRIRHLAMMNKAQRDILEEHFITEQESVYSAAESVMENFSKGSRRSFASVYGKTVESIHMMYAQKALLSHEAKTFNQGQLDNFVETFVAKIEAVQQLIQGVESVHSESKTKFIMDKHAKRGYDGLNQGEQDIYNQLIKEAELSNVIAGDIIVKGENIKLADFLASNPFIQSLQISEVNDKKKVTMKKSFSSLSQSEQELRKLGYNELQLVHPQLAKEILDYQLLNNGMNQKIGSYAELFPMSVHIQYLKELSKRTTFAKEDEKGMGVAKAQRKAFEINTALQYVELLDKAKIGDTDLKKKYYNVNGELYIYENKQVDPVTGGLVSSPQKRLVPASKYDSFMTNGDYYKLGDLEQYAKISFDKTNVSKEEMDELKKCIRLNKIS